MSSNTENGFKQPTSGSKDNIFYQNGSAEKGADYLEIFIANNTDTSNLTVEDLNVIIERLN